MTKQHITLTSSIFAHILSRYHSYLYVVFSECPCVQYGINCADTCICNFTHTMSCDSRNGSCYCKQGWEGPACNTDVKECSNNETICGANAVCSETPGSYNCSCKPGFMYVEGVGCEGMQIKKENYFENLFRQKEFLIKNKKIHCILRNLLTCLTFTFLS